MASHKFLITAATGTVGRPLTLKLLAMGHQVHALTTNPHSSRAQEIAQAGAKLFNCTLDDKGTISEAAKTCTGVYLNPMPADISKHFEEATYASNIISAAHEAGVKTCVYHSVEGTDIITRLPEWNQWISKAGIVSQYWTMKTTIQRSVQTAGFESWTAIQGSMHFSNFGERYINMLFMGLRDEPVGVLSFPVREDTKVHLVDPEDLAELAARALTVPEKFNGRAFNAVGQVLTLREIAEIIAKYAGKRVRASAPDQETVIAERSQSLSSGNGQVLDILAERADYEFCRGLGVEYNTLDTYLGERQEELRRAIA